MYPLGLDGERIIWVDNRPVYMWYSDDQKEEADLLIEAEGSASLLDL
jgi:hypothetical protein